MEPLRSRGAQVLPLDIAEPTSRRQLADRINGEVGALDALVNNAGYGETGPVETMPVERARAMFEVNLFGLIGLTQLLLPPMRERRRGHIVNLSSIAKAGRDEMQTSLQLKKGSALLGTLKVRVKAAEAIKPTLGPDFDDEDEVPPLM